MNDELGRALGPAERMLAQIADALPSLGLGLVVLVVGLLLAVVARRLAISIGTRFGLDALAEKVGIAKLLYALQIRGGLGSVLGHLVFLIVVLITLSMSAEIVGLPGVADGVGSVVEFLPRLISAGVVAVFGFAAAEFGSRLAEGLGQRRTDLIAPKLAANIVYYLVLAVALTTAVQHLGMDTFLINLLIGVVLASVLGSGALAFAWAGRRLLQDVLARPYLQRHLAPGRGVTVGEVSGVVATLGTLTVAIDCPDGSTAILPYRRFLSEPGFVLSPEDEDSAHG